MEVSGYRFTTLINNLYLATEGRVERLFISIEDSKHVPRRNVGDFSEAIVKGGYDLSDLSFNLRELSFYIPFPFSFSCGEYRENSKRITLKGFQIEEEALIPVIQLKNFIREATAFTGQGLTWIYLNSRYVLDGWKIVDGTSTKTTRPKFNP